MLTQRETNTRWRSMSVLFVLLAVLLTTLINGTSKVYAQIDENRPIDTTITGQVTNEQGYPLANIQVQFGTKQSWTMPDGTPCSYFSEWNNVETDSNGNYTFSYYGDGAHYVRFSDSSNHYAAIYGGNSTSLHGATPINFNNSEPVTVTINGVLPKSGSIQGTVSLPYKINSDTSASVDLYIKSEGGWERVSDIYLSLKDRRNYEFHGLLSGSYWVLANYTDFNSYPLLSTWYPNQTELASAEMIQLAPEEIKKGIDIQLIHDKNYMNEIKGRVTDSAGRPIPYVFVSLFTPPTWYDEFSTHNSYTDADGYYSFTNLPNNEYKVQFARKRDSWNSTGKQQYASVFNGQRLTLGHAEAKKLQDGETWVVNATLSEGATVQGKILFDGKSIKPSSIDLWRWNDWDAWLRVVDGYPNGGEGIPSFLGLQPGRYRIELKGIGDNYETIWYGGDTDPESALEFTVQLGQNKNLPDFVIPVRNGVSGQVTDYTGKPMADVSVDIIRKDDDQSSDYVYLSSYTDAEGRYKFLNIPEGNYRVSTSSSNTTLFYGNTPNAKLATLIEVTNEVVTADLQRWAPAAVKVNIKVDSVLLAQYEEDNTLIEAELYWQSGSEWYFVTNFIDSDYNQKNGITTWVDNLPAGNYKIKVITDLYSYDYSQQETITQWYQNSLSQEEANIFTLKEWQTVPIDLVVSRN